MRIHYIKKLFNWEGSIIKNSHFSKNNIGVYTKTFIIEPFLN